MHEKQYIVAVDNMNSKTQVVWVSVLALTLFTCVSFGKLLDFSMLPYFISKTGITAATS